MKISKKTKMFVAVAFALGVAATGAGVIHAATTTANSTNPMNSLVSAIASKFNLNVTDVQQVFDDQRAQMETERKQQAADRIKQAVTDSKLTQDQADKIIAKQAEVSAFMETLKDKTDTERDAAMKTEMDSLKQWATDNSIPMQYMMFLGGHGGPGRGFGHGPRGGHFGEGAPTPSVTQ